MKNLRILPCMLMAAGCAGTLETARLDHRSQTDVAMKGVSYALPMLQYDIEVRQTLTGCGDFESADQSAANPSLSFTTEIESKGRYVPGERFNVDYSRLSGLFRTSSFAVSYHPNGTIKSLGIGADDKSGEALGSLAKLAGGVLSLTAGSPSLPVEDGLVTGNTDEPVSFYGCTAETRKAVADLETSAETLKGAKERLEKANIALEGLAKRFALEVSGNTDAATWDAAVSEQLSAQKALEGAKKAYEAAKKPLGGSYTMRWPQDRIPASGRSAFRDHFVTETGLAKPWAQMLEPMTLSDPPDSLTIEGSCTVGANNTQLECLSAHLDLVLDFESDWPELELRKELSSSEPVRKVATSGQTLEGILFREPWRGGLVICLEKRATGGECSDDRLVKPEMVNFPQMGQLRFIPFRVFPFQGKDMGIEFSEDGTPSTITFKSTKAAGAEALASLAGATGTLSEAFEKREEERRSDLKAARDNAIAELGFEIERLEKEAKLAELNAPDASPSEASIQLAALQSDIELKRAQLIQLMLDRALTEGSIDPSVLFSQTQ